MLNWFEVRVGVPTEQLHLAADTGAGIGRAEETAPVAVGTDPREVVVGRLHVTAAGKENQPVSTIDCTNATSGRTPAALPSRGSRDEVADRDRRTGYGLRVGPR